MLAMGVSVTGGSPGYLRLYHRRRHSFHGGTLLGYRGLQNAQRRAIDMRKFGQAHRRALRRVEHPSRNLDKHRIEWRLGQFAEVSRIGVRTTRRSG
jgi:hypothetical protein